MVLEPRPIIEMRHVTHRFADGSIGIEDVSLKIHEGEVVLMIGPNGSGKTTLFRLLIGLLLPQQGEILVEGISVRKDVLHARKRIGMVFQDADCQIVGETVASDVAFGPENLCLNRSDIETRIDQSLKAVGLEALADRRPHTLSGGEKRRLAIAGMLAMKPRVLVLDEPFANLDYPGMQSIVTILKRLIEDRNTILIASHQVDAIYPLLTRMVLLHRGKLVADGPPGQILPKAVAMGILGPNMIP
uniref:ABC transporter ATP-binding protein n=1 Tax=Desulfatirhabdium butyrativorans TaxID=340467 RepID=A0A7C4RNS8_9BACT